VKERKEEGRERKTGEGREAREKEKEERNK